MVSCRGRRDGGDAIISVPGVYRGITFAGGVAGTRQWGGGGGGGGGGVQAQEADSSRAAYGDIDVKHMLSVRLPVAFIYGRVQIVVGGCS